MIHLLNSAMMPSLDGTYTIRRISQAEFNSLLRESLAVRKLKNYIGYGDNLRILREEFGVHLQTSREQAVVTNGDCLLIMKLKYRVRDPGEKAGKARHEIADFEFAISTFRAA